MSLESVFNNFCANDADAAFIESTQMKRAHSADFLYVDVQEDGYEVVQAKRVGDRYSAAPGVLLPLAPLTDDEYCCADPGNSITYAAIERLRRDFDRIRDERDV